MPRYAYSYDREDYTGAFDTPEKAFDDAISRAQWLPNPPTTIYVGEVVKADPQAADHARSIIDHMSQRAHVDYGAPAARYLRNVTAEQVRALDQSLENAILAWLEHNRLMPTFVKVRGIREYAVPTTGPMTRPVGQHNGEVHDLGLAETPDHV